MTAARRTIDADKSIDEGHSRTLANGMGNVFCAESREDAREDFKAPSDLLDGDGRLKAL